VAGTIEFSDLLGMVTAPNQFITIESFNPGIAVDRGELRFQLNPGYELAILGGEWPFIGGTLELQPTTTRLTEPVERRFVLKLTGVDAAQFIERDGARQPFGDRQVRRHGAAGVRREWGADRRWAAPLAPARRQYRLCRRAHLRGHDPRSRNYAFDMLKSLDYREMEINLSGSLTGEIVTKVRFDGIRQGAGTSQNIITRQLAKLPIQFNVNIHAPFYQLIGTFKSNVRSRLRPRSARPRPDRRQRQPRRHARCARPSRRSSPKTCHKLTTAFSPEKVRVCHERHEIDLPWSPGGIRRRWKHDPRDSRERRDWRRRWRRSRHWQAASR